MQTSNSSAEPDMGSVIAMRPNVMKLKSVLMICFCLFGISIGYTQADLKMTETQIKDMGINLMIPKQVSSISSKEYPAQVTIPNDRTRVLTSMMPGIVNILYVAEGDTITKGQKLVEISSPDFLEAQQNYLAALSRLSVSRRDHDRNSDLIKEGIISEKTFLTGQSDLNEAEALLARTQQSLIFSGMSDKQIDELKQSRKLMGTMVISAPFDGTILKQMAMTGEHIDKMTPLYHIGQLDELWVEIHVPLKLRQSIEVGNIINIEGADIKGKIITIGQMVHEEDQGILVRGLLEKNQSQFIPGQFINVTLEQKIHQNAFYRIPSGAVIREDNQATLFVHTSDGFLFKKVDIIAEESTSLVVRGNISSQDQIAISGIVTLKGILEGLGSEE